MMMTGTVDGRGKRIVYWYEKDYIMRLIHGIAQALAYLYFGKRMEDEEELASVMGHKA